MSLVRTPKAITKIIVIRFMIFVAVALDFLPLVREYNTASTNADVVIENNEYFSKWLTTLLFVHF